jgi:hypothetical protein
MWLNILSITNQRDSNLLMKWLSLFYNYFLTYT